MSVRAVPAEATAKAPGFAEFVALVALTMGITALSIDNLLPAWSVMFFCLAAIEGDGAMAALGWLFALLSAIWTGFLLIVGQAVVIQVLKSLF